MKIEGIIAMLIAVLFFAVLFAVAICGAKKERAWKRQQTALLLRIATAQEATLAVLKRGVRTEINWSLPAELPPCVGEVGP